MSLMTYANGSNAPLCRTCRTALRPLESRRRWRSVESVQM